VNTRRAPFHSQVNQQHKQVLTLPILTPQTKTHIT